jgi:hypothetical protein
MHSSFLIGKAIICSYELNLTHILKKAIYYQKKSSLFGEQLFLIKNPFLMLNKVFFPSYDIVFLFFKRFMGNVQCRCKDQIY